MCRCVENPQLICCRFGNCLYLSSRSNVDQHETWCQYGEVVLVVPHDKRSKLTQDELAMLLPQHAAPTLDQLSPRSFQSKFAPPALLDASSSSASVWPTVSTPFETDHVTRSIKRRFLNPFRSSLPFHGKQPTDVSGHMDMDD